MMAGITSVSFGPNDSWIVCENSEIWWSRGLPTPIYNKLDGRRNNRSCASTNVAAMGHNEDFALFFDNYKWWVRCNGLSDDLNEDGIGGRDVKTCSFGDNGSYLLLLKSGHVFWRGVPSRLDQLIQTRSHARIQWATIGHGGSYFIKYSDGMYYWGGNCNEYLDDSLNAARGIDKVWLSPFNEDYYIAFSDGTSQWVASESFSNSRLCDKWMNPKYIYYTNNSISQEFSCGRCIHDTVRELEQGILFPDDLPCIYVFEYQGYAYSLNNRRLWVLSAAGVDSTPVKIVAPPYRIVSKLRNGFQGRSISLR